MSDVINKTTLEYRRSVHTPDYMSGGEWLINPVLPECDRKYWKIKNDEVVEMTTAQKAAVDAAVTAQQKEFEKDMLIAGKQQEISRAEAIQALKDDGVLDSSGNLIGG